MDLRQSLSEKVRRTFRKGSRVPPAVLDRTVRLQHGGSELAGVGLRPAKMSALHSSPALDVNVFDYWMDSETAALLAALGLGAGTGLRLSRHSPPA